MVKIIVFISFVFILMTLILFYIIKGIIDNIKEKSRLYFALKIQEYEEGKKEEQIKLEQTMKLNTKDITDKDDNNNTLVYVENKNDYEVEDLFMLTKLIDDDFRVNTKDLIINFLCQNTSFEGYDLYNKLLLVKEDIDKFGEYNILTNNSLKDEFIDLLNSKYKNIYKSYINNKEDFDINDFKGYIDSLLNENNPTIYILVGQKSENYDTIDNRIKTIYDDSIYKGFKIIYKNKMYDYSLG